MQIKNPEKITRIATIATLSFLICWGLVQVVSEIRPFWVDEWRVIYNLKFKTATALWGPLDFMQQFPRVYIELLKAFTSRFGYSYSSLRLPSYLIGTFTIFFCYRLANRIYGHMHFNGLLFVMVLISCSTFTDYYVQVKQYTMDILLCLVALWQLLELLDISNQVSLRKTKYVWLCVTFIFVPFLSYTYPIAIAPAFMVLFIQSIHLLKNGDTGNKGKTLLLVWFPLLLCTTSISIFYITDVAQLMRDGDMHKFWAHLLMDGGFSWRSFFINIWMLFAEIGSGFVYWWLMGILGLTSLIYAIYNKVNNFKKNIRGTGNFIRLYSVLLVMLCIVLFAAGKLPLGEPRLNAFTIPAISILLIHLLDKLQERIAFTKIISVILYTGLIGNIYTTFFASITDPGYTRKINSYRSTEVAIKLAQKKNIPILITPGVAYPYDKTLNLPFKTTVPGDWVLKTFPAYSAARKIRVYAISDTNTARELINKLPPDITSVLVGDGQNYYVINRQSTN